MSEPSYPGIPEPTLSLEGLMNTVLQLKIAVEMLSGQRTGPSYGAPRIFVQPKMPTTNDIGDLWINTALNNKLHFWDGRNWTQTT